jgi:hypothetical protein
MLRFGKEKLDPELQQLLETGEIPLRVILGERVKTNVDEDVKFLKDLLFFLYDRQALESIQDADQRESIRKAISTFEGAIDPRRYKREMRTFRKIMEAIFNRIFFEDQEVKLIIDDIVMEDLMEELASWPPEAIRDVLGIEEETIDGEKRYFIRLNREKILKQRLEISREEIERSRELAELVERYNQLEKLYKEVRRLCKDNKAIATYLDVAIFQIRQIMKLRDRLKPPEMRKLREEIDKRIEEFNRIKETRKITPAEAKRRLINGMEILKGVLSSIGLWGLALGWFLPLWLISKMYDAIAQSKLAQKK